MATFDLDGWLILSNGVDTWKVPYQTFEYDLSAEPEIDNLPGDSRIGFDLGSRKRTVKINMLHFESAGDLDDCMDDLEDWNDAGAWDLRIQISSSPTYFPFSKAGSTIKVLFKDFRGVTKTTKGDIQHFIIKMLLLKEAA